MTTFTVDAPDDVLLLLRDRAALNQRSPEGEALAIIAAAVKPETDYLSPEELLALVRRLGVSSPGDGVEIIRADRDRDDDASYLWLARSRNLELVRLDKKLAAASTP